MSSPWHSLPTILGTWTGSGSDTVLLLRPDQGGLVSEPMPSWFLPTGCRVALGGRVGPLVAREGGAWLPLRGRYVPPQTPLWMPGEAAEGVYVYGMRLHEPPLPSWSAAMSEEEGRADDLVVPVVWREHAPAAEPEPVIAAAKPDGQVDEELRAAPNPRRDLGPVHLAVLFVKFGEVTTPVGILPEVAKFLERDHRFHWHGDAPPASALYPPQVAGCRPEAPALFYSTELRQEVQRLWRQP